MVEDLPTAAEIAYWEQQDADYAQWVAEQCWRQEDPEAPAGPVDEDLPHHDCGPNCETCYDYWVSAELAR